MIQIAGRTYRFEDRRDIVFLCVIGASLLFVVGLQQLIPSGRPLPFARVNGRFRTVDSEQAIVHEYSKRLDNILTLTAGDSVYRYTIRDLGVSLDPESTVRQYMPESRLKRLIPFSVINQILQSQDPIYTSDLKSLSLATEAIADELSKEGENAELVIDQSGIVVTESKDAVVFAPKKSTFAILDAITRDQSEVTLKTDTIEPDVTTSELQSVIRDFVATLPESLTITVDINSVDLPKATMLSWLTYRSVESLPQVYFDETKIQIYADSLSEKHSLARRPTATTVSLVNGKETSRIEGSAGQSIIASELVKQINQAIVSKSTTVNAKIVDVPSPIKYLRNYTKSEVGLQELVDTLTDGKSVSIRYVDISDRGWDVGSKEHVQSRMASTYKMFVAYSVLKRIESGQMSFNDDVNGLTIDQCLQMIIIESNNECAIAIAERIGWQTLASEGRALGATGLNWTEDLWGTAYDASIIPIKLARGEILTEANRNYLLDLMQRQQFREGIPSGTAHTVADKVGFIDGWLNDAAIIYAPGRTYVLVVYSYGESWEVIAEITHQIEALAL